MKKKKKRLGYEMPQNVPASVLARCSVVEATEQFTWNIWAISSGEVAANWRGKWGTLIMHRNSCTNRITLKYCNCSGRPSFHLIFSSFIFFCSRPSAQIVIKTKVYKRRGNGMKQMALGLWKVCDGRLERKGIVGKQGWRGRVWAVKNPFPVFPCWRTETLHRFVFLLSKRI